MNPICTYYAIRKKGTYLFLPECARGSTHTEPVDCTVQRMRTFLTRKAANQALRYWVKGRWTNRTGTDDDFFGNPITVVTGIQCEPVPERDIKDMEVVPVYLRLNQSDML